PSSAGGGSTRQWATITFKSACTGSSACVACGVSSIALTNMEMTDDQQPSNSITPITPNNGSITSQVVDVNLPFGTQDWTVPSDDSDCDAFPDSVSITNLSSESHMGTNPNGRCAADTTRNNEPAPDRWPADFDDNQLANGTDLLSFAAVFGKSM